MSAQALLTTSTPVGAIDDEVFVDWEAARHCS
jgi:hypothetical protein